MTSALVVDASIAFSWVHPDQATTETDELLKNIESGATAVVPGLWFVEVANGLLQLERRNKLTAAHRKVALATLASLNPTVDEEWAKAAFQKTSELAEKYGLSVYDATYLELAQRRKLPLASRDAALLAAAKRCGLKVL